MNDVKERERLVPKYFIKTPEPPQYILSYLQIAGGALLAFFGLITLIAQDSTGVVCCSLFFMAGGALTGFGFLQFIGKRSKYSSDYKKAEPKPSDKQMDAWQYEDIERIKKDALEKLDLLPEQIMGDPNDPILVVGPSSDAMFASGKDKVIRFSLYDVLVVYLTDYHLAAFKGTLNMVDGIVTNESTQEYHYTDVVSVSTQTDSSGLFAIMVDGEKKPIASLQKFALSVASGEQIQVAIAFPQLQDVIKEGKLAETGADKAIKIIRARLREKKGGIQA